MPICTEIETKNNDWNKLQELVKNCNFVVNQRLFYNKKYAGKGNYWLIITLKKSKKSIALLLKGFFSVEDKHQICLDLHDILIKKIQNATK